MKFFHLIRHNALMLSKSFGKTGTAGETWLLGDPYKSGNVKRRSAVSDNYVPGVSIISSIACQHFDLN